MTAIATVPQHSLVSFPIPAVQIVSQLEIITLLSLKNRARQLEAQIVEAEESVRERLESGAPVEAGEHTASLKESFRRNVAWREVSERLAERLYGEGRGEAYCENVLQNTKPSRSVSLVLL